MIGLTWALLGHGSTPWVSPPPVHHRCHAVPSFAIDSLVFVTCRLPDRFQYEAPWDSFAVVNLVDARAWGPSDVQPVLDAAGCDEAVATRATTHQGHLAIDHSCRARGVVGRAVLKDGRWLVAVYEGAAKDPNTALDRADEVLDQVRFRDLELP